MTSIINHDVFYNYMLEGFEIKNVPRIVYVDGSFKEVNNNKLSNDYLKDEIKEIKKDSYYGEEHLFRR